MTVESPRNMCYYISFPFRKSHETTRKVSWKKLWPQRAPKRRRQNQNQSRSPRKRSLTPSV